MSKKTLMSVWARQFSRGVRAMTRSPLARAPSRAGLRLVKRAANSAAASQRPPPGDGDWLPGLAVGAAGARRWRLYRPPGVAAGERLPLMVMLHGCGQDAKSFAVSTRMNRVAARERFLVLYPEQDRLSQVQGCWNWYDTGSGRAYGEAALIMAAIDQVCLLYPVDRARLAVMGLSAGASMAALLVTRNPGRFKALVMHSGVPPGTAHSTASALGAMRGRRATAPLPVAATGLAQALPPLLVIHGGSDAVVAVSNGRAAAQQWADACGAAAGVVRGVQRGKRYPLQVTDFKRRRRTLVSLVEVAALGHAWSGGAPNQPFSDQRGPDASRMAWAFAARQFSA